MLSPDTGAARPLSWKSLFAEQPTLPEVQRREVVVLKKGGEPLLVVPPGRAGVIALALYPAQTARARLARRVWRWSLRVRLIPGAERDSLALAPGGAFAQYLKSLAGGSEIPLFALLAGNPRAVGRRFLVLVFNAHGQPVAVVKAGTDPAAAELIHREASFLQDAPPGTPGLPRLRGVFREGYVHALALDFIPGDSPPAHPDGHLEQILNAWLNREPQVKVETLAGWQRLARASQADELFQRLAPRLQGLRVHTALFHGDLAPWNIKVSPAGDWTVLDWERGDWSGMPGWDWFHFVLQPAMLVQRQSSPELVRTTNRLLESNAVRNYMQAAGLAGKQREWLLAYLLHCRDVLRPAEGLQQTSELLRLLAQQWAVS